MKFAAELEFVDKLLSKYKLSLRYIQEPDRTLPMTYEEDNFRSLLHLESHDEEILDLLFNECESNTVYRIHDPFMCHYLMFKLPDEDSGIYVYLGPYIIEDISSQFLLNLAQKFSLSPEEYTEIEKYYANLPRFAEEDMLLTILYTLGEKLWGCMDNFTFRDSTDFFLTFPENELSFSEPETPFSPALSTEILEKRYESERNMMSAISTGQIHKIQMMMNNFTIQNFENRNMDSIRNAKNYAIVANTLFRKSAEFGGVHPYHINDLSSRYATRIELLISATDAVSLIKEMAHKYCLLVKNHSMKGYSLLVKKVITRIDSDLTADLGLKTQAKLLNVNSSYLSTLFKKETGMTLTEYVNRKRVEHAILLLNSTNMQIQMIAQYCGISDVNYFTKTFKKYIGKTPKEYRESIAPYR